MTRLILLLLASSLVAPAAWAGNFIAGQVLDRNGDPVVRAQVKLQPDNEEKGTFLMVTDSDGRFVIDYLRDSEGDRTKLAKKTNYELEVFKAGFHIETRQFFYKRGPVEMEEITLTEDTVRIDDVKINIAGSLERKGDQESGHSYEGQ